MPPKINSTGDSMLNNPQARKAVRQRAQADTRNIPAQQKAQDSGIDYWLQQHHKFEISAPLPSLDATADLILANHLISHGLNSREFAGYRRDDALAEHAYPHPLDTPLTESQPRPKKGARGSKPWDGEIVLNQKMQAVKSKKQKPRTDQQLRIRKMTKNAGGACSKHRRLKQFVS